MSTKGIWGQNSEKKIICLLAITFLSQMSLFISLNHVDLRALKDELKKIRVQFFPVVLLQYFDKGHWNELLGYFEAELWLRLYGRLWFMLLTIFDDWIAFGSVSVNFKKEGKCCQSKPALPNKRCHNSVIENEFQYFSSKRCGNRTIAGCTGIF